MDSPPDAQQLESSRRRVQQLTKDYGNNSGFQTRKTHKADIYATYPDDFEQNIPKLRQRLSVGVLSITQTLRITDILSPATNHFHNLLQEHEHVTENPTNRIAINNGFGSKKSAPV